MHAPLNVTWANQNGSLPDPVLYDATDVEILQWAQEAIQNGDIPGIATDPAADLTDFIVQRFPITDEVPTNRLFVRPKTPFGE